MSMFHNVLGFPCEKVEHLERCMALKKVYTFNN
jgi:hypothetical protein